MPIHLITGIPGHGKTNRMVGMIRAAAQKGDRPVFVCGVDGLQPGMAGELKDGADWQSCPDGSLIFIDEAWKWFGHLGNASRQQTPAHVLALAEHRHRGIDFVWTAQGPNQIYPFARPLIEQHWHCVRKFGTQMVEVYKWGELVEDPKSQGMRDRSEKEISTLDTSVFGAYKSASEHTIKARLPWKLWLIPVCVLLAIVAAWLAYSQLRPDAMAANASGGQDAGLPASDLGGSGGGSGAGADVPMSPEQWIARLTPRFPGMPESAPAFDGREVAAVPRRFCVIGGAGEDARCNCYTEQATPIADVPQAVCLHAARWGEYDPFRGQPDERERQDYSQAEPPATTASASSPGGITTPATQVGHPAGALVGASPR